MTDKTELESVTDEVCPACGSADVEDSYTALGAVCVSCGAVASTAVHADTSRELSDPDTERGEWSDHYSIRNSTEQQVASALESLEQLGQRLPAPLEVRERAAEIYGEAAVEKTTDGRATEAVVAAALVIAGRELGRPHSVGHVADVADIGVGQLRRALSAIRSDLDLHFVYCPPSAYLPELTREFDLDDATNAVARQILDNLPPNRVGGRHPAAVAGSALYLAADDVITQRDVARVTGVTTETVRLRVKECREVASVRGRQQANDVGAGDE